MVTEQNTMETQNEPQTIRESLDVYKSRMIAAKGPLGVTEYELFPTENHPFALKASSDEIKRIFGESGQVKFAREVIRPKNEWHIYSWDLPTQNTSFAIDCLDKGGADRTCYCEEYNLGKEWTPCVLYVHGFHNDSYIRAVNTLEIILSVAEKNRISMITNHKGEMGARPLVRYNP